MSRLGDDVNGSADVAPWYRVPDKSIMAVEHPCVVKNVDKAVDMLGGPAAIEDSLSIGPQRTLALNFHPRDRASRSIISFHNHTENVLLKVTVPKRSGRKRKRGSDDPFIADAACLTQQKDAPYLLRSLEDNPIHYTVSPLATIPSTHIFRSMPDFVYSTADSTFMNEMRRTVLPNQYPLLKTWTLPRTYGLQDTYTIPPPVLSTQSLPQNYTYRQNPAVKHVTNPITGAVTLHNTQAPLKIHTIQCQWDTPTYPSCPPLSIPELSSQAPQFITLVTQLQHLFKLHPIYTRRSLLNSLPAHSPIFLARHALAYVAYAIRSGPWRDTYVLYGVDPRSDPRYRKYQSILLQLLPSSSSTEPDAARTEFARTWSRAPTPNSHIFSGTGPIPPDGKCWLLKDITDPDLQPLVDIPDIFISPVCSARYLGWYPNGTLTKLRIALKAKVDQLLGPPGAASSWPSLMRILALPEEWDGTSRRGRDGGMLEPMDGYLPRDASKRELEWAAAYRAICRTDGDAGSVGGRLRVRGTLVEDGDGEKIVARGAEDDEQEREEQLGAAYVEPAQGDDDEDEENGAEAETDNDKENEDDDDNDDDDNDDGNEEEIGNGDGDAVGDGNLTPQRLR